MYHVHEETNFANYLPIKLNQSSLTRYIIDRSIQLSKFTLSLWVRYYCWQHDVLQIFADCTFSSSFMDCWKIKIKFTWKKSFVCTHKKIIQIFKLAYQLCFLQGRLLICIVKRGYYKGFVTLDYFLNFFWGIKNSSLIF